MKKIKIECFIDPISSLCYVISPRIKKLIEKKGQNINLTYHFGGLLKNWEGFVDPKFGITKPSDVADHWAKVSEQEQVEINGSVWLTDPVDSSYPPSIAYFAVKSIDSEKAMAFLEGIQKALFIEGKNIARVSILAQIAESLDISVDVFLEAYGNPSAQKHLRDDLLYTRKKNITVFPTILIYGPQSTIRLKGIQSYETYEKALEEAMKQ